MCRKMSRNWCFTINYADEEHEEAIYPETDWPDVRYYIYQEEIGENNTHHLQGYAQFNVPKRLTQLKKMSGLERAHLEPQRGTAQQAKDYCCKDDDTTLPNTRVEWGEFKAGQGQRTDILKLRNMVKEGKSMKEIYNNDETLIPAIQFSNGLQRMVSTFNQDIRRDFKTIVEVYVGATGAGKTRKAVEDNPNIYMKPHDKWWDGYQMEDVVLFDDFYGWYPYNQLLILCDRYECPVEYKGGHMKIAPKKVIITSNTHIHHWYDREKVKDIAPLLRRVDKYCWFTKDGIREYEDSGMDDGLPVWFRNLLVDLLPGSGIE